MIFCFNHHTQWNTRCIKRKHKVPCPRVIIVWHAQGLCVVCKNFIIMVPIDDSLSCNEHNQNYFRICYVCELLRYQILFLKFEFCFYYD